MIMIVLNKEKIKKITWGIICMILIIPGIAFLVNDTQAKATSKMVDSEQPYFTGIKPNSGYVALTCNVDLGWESEYVEGILKVLKEEDVKITFNVTGRWAEKNQDLLLKIKSEGHEIGNHGHKHLDYANLSYEENLEQIKTSKTIIENIIKEIRKVNSNSIIMVDNCYCEFVSEKEPIEVGADICVGSLIRCHRNNFTL